MNNATLITFIAYLVAIFAIGVVAYRSTRDLSDYILGGRRLNGPVAALSAGASDMSGWLLLGLPGALYASGLSDGWIVLGLSLGAYINWRLVAGRLRVHTEALDDALTLPDYFERRFEDSSRLLRVITALIILVFFTVYSASGLVAGAKLFQGSFGMDYSTGLWLGAAVIVAYTFLGGFLAVSWTDFFQGVLMLLAMVVTPLVVLYELGGLQAAIDATAAIAPDKLDAFAGLTVIGFLSLMAWGLGYAGQPHVLVRFMAVRRPRDVGPARRIALSWMIAGMLGAISTGFLGVAYFAGHPDMAAQLAADPEKVFILMTQVVFNPWMAGVLLAAILAAAMSTIDSQLLVSSSALTEDFYKVFIRRGAGDGELMWVGRLGVLGIALVAIAVASDPNSLVLDLVSYAWAGLGASFGPVVILSLYWSGMNRFGALAGMLAGAATVIIWKQLPGGIFELYELLPGFMLSCLAIVVISRLTGGAGTAVRDTFSRNHQRVLDEGV